MSSHAVQAPADPGRLPMTLPLLAEKKRLRRTDRDGHRV